MTAINITLHNSLPYLSDEERSYDGIGADVTRPAPKYVRSILAWERAAQKVVAQTGKSYLDWNGNEFRTATVIYKRTFVKYGLNQPGPDPVS